MMHKRHVLLAAALATVLAACGGGGTDTPPAPPPGGDVSGVYRQEPTPANAQAAAQQLDRMGASGHVWVSGVASNEPAPQTAQLFLNSTLRPAATFRYALDAEPGTMAQWLAQLNERGRQGYAYKGDYAYETARMVFVKDLRPAYAAVTYGYESLPAGNDASLSALLAQLNTQGARGFRWLGLRATSVAPATFSNVYMKDNSHPSAYSYTAHALGASPAPADGQALLSAMRQGSAAGAHYLGTWQSASGYAMLFEQQAGDAAAVEYALEPVSAHETLASLLAAINAQAARGWFYWSDHVTADGRVHRIYVKNRVLHHPLYGLVYP